VLVALAGCGRLRFDDLLDASAGGDSHGDGGTVCSAWATPQPVTVLNTTQPEYDPELSPDGSWLLMSRNLGGLNDLFLAQAAGGSFTTPQPITALNSAADEGSPAWAPAGDLVYFVSKRTGIYRLYSATFSAGTFGAPALVPELASFGIDSVVMSSTGTELLFSNNSGPSDRLQRATRADPSASWGTPAPIAELATITAAWPSLSADGTTLYFESDDASIKGTLYVVTRPTPNDPFGTPRPLTEIGDASASEGDPFISHDGQTFLFDSDRAGTAGRTDVFMTTRTCR
jgi:hypothetical protein